MKETNLTQAQLNTYMTDEARWRAVSQRDQAADGTFYYAVRSTGVYCRPNCPSRRPKRENVSFFEQMEDASAAGYRPCLRCTPDQVNVQQRAVAHAKHLLETSDPTPSLDALSATIGLSPTHLQRVFKRSLGLSPKQYALHLRAERLKLDLKEGRDVTSAMYDAGHGSSRSLYDSATDQLGMLPAAYKKGGLGQTIAYTIAESPLGSMLVAATEHGLCAIWFGESETLVQDLHNEYLKARFTQDAGSLQTYIQAILVYLDGQQSYLNLTTDAAGTVFQQRVWDTLRTIPYGETRSYAQVAEMIGEPKAVRAVARACPTNPVALVVPCHRVVRSGGQLSGYRWGVDRKRALLEREANERQGERSVQ